MLDVVWASTRNGAHLKLPWVQSSSCSPNTFPNVLLGGRPGPIFAGDSKSLTWKSGRHRFTRPNFKTSLSMAIAL